MARLLLHVFAMMVIVKTKEHLKEITDFLFNWFRAAGQVVLDEFPHLGMNIEIDREIRIATVDQSICQRFSMGGVRQTPAQ